jgi:hypothetical protein
MVTPPKSGHVAARLRFAADLRDHSSPRASKRAVMRYTLTTLEDDFDRLRQHLFSGRVVERAGYLLCRLSRTATETRLLTREFFPVADSDIKRATAGEMLIDRRSYVDAMQRADRDRSGLIFVHSHPLGPVGHSIQDERELPKLFDACRVRIRHDVLHGSMVFSEEDVFEARVWLPDGTSRPISVIRSIGNRFSFFFPEEPPQQSAATFDRQVRAFGDEAQLTLSRLHVGIVGYGGTGSSVGEQLLRLGVGTLTVCDGDSVTKTNLTRVYSSECCDDGTPKVNVAERLSSRLGFGSAVHAIAAEVDAALNPELAESRRRDGYAPELTVPDPAVIFFTTAIASAAVAEFFARLTGYAGVERPDEILHRFSSTRISTVSRTPGPECFCGNRRYWGVGDVTPLLDLTWRDDS